MFVHAGTERRRLRFECTTKPTHPSNGGQAMAQQEFTDAIALLKYQHDEVEELFEKFEKASGSDTKWQLAQKICNKLKIHTMIEEEIFYPATKDLVEKDLYREAFVEHDGAKVLVNDIVANGPDDKFFESKVKVLSEEVEHHVKEEEQRETGYFAQVRDGDVDLVALRDKLQARTDELTAQAQNGGLPPAQLQTVDADAS
jgi:hemerythrin superfamily protein